jgi:hypothetical protein
VRHDEMSSGVRRRTTLIVRQLIEGKIEEKLHRLTTIS